MTVSSRASKVGSHESAGLSTTDSRLPTTDYRLPTIAASRVIIENVRPEIDGGRFPIKRTVGERVHVTADIFADGHDVVVAVLRDRGCLNAELAKHAENPLESFSAGSAGSAFDDAHPWRETQMFLVAPGSDEWAASFETAHIGWHEYEIVAWVDRFQTWG